MSSKSDSQNTLTESPSSSNNNTPLINLVQLPTTSTPAFLFPFRSRGQSTSAMRSPSPSPSPLPTSPLARVTSAPSGAISDDTSSWFLTSHNLLHSPPTRTKKLSDPGIDSRKNPGRSNNLPTPGTPSTWWNRTDIASRGWKDSPKRKQTIPAEHTEAWLHTRDRVRQAVSAVLGNASDVAHEALVIGVDVLRFAPIAGLSEAARTLLGIWDSLQKVDMNRMACLRLTERCADVLLSIRDEIAEAGGDVGEELKHPLAKLEASFAQIHRFLQSQCHLPFLKRYLKRDDILRQIDGCGASLNESVGLFSLAIQIRILKQVQRAELARQTEAEALLRASARADIIPPLGESLLLSAEPEGLPAVPFPTSDDDKETLISPTSPTSPIDLDVLASKDPSHIREVLRELHGRQNEIDHARDMFDLRGLMRTALQANSDVEMIEVLQVGQDEMPEAIKTLQRALEREVEKESVEGLATSPTASGETMTRRISVKEVTVPVPPLPGTAPVQDGDPNVMSRRHTVVSVVSASSVTSHGVGRDTLDREFMESGIDAMRRVSHSDEVDLPSWTITRYEVEPEERIGIGFFSNVYRGTWRGRTVAIKILANTTPRDMFIREVKVWKLLRHPNVLELYGASAATSEGPWFFVSPYCRNGSLVSYLRHIADKSGSGSRSHSRTRNDNVGVVGPYDTPKPGQEFVLEYENVDMVKMMYEIARGMQYLHSMGVLHGDLKGANVLVDDKIRCVISDFGQSEMKSEVYRITGTSPPHGTFRWQAPEILEGRTDLTTEADVYSFAICCIEILTMGSVPWSALDDKAVRELVLKYNQRPNIPRSRVTTPALQDLLRLCWHRNPFLRPSFSKVVWDIKQMRVNDGAAPFVDETMSPPALPTPDRPLRPSPDMRPGPLPIAVSIPTSPTREGVNSPSDMYFSASGSPMSPFSDAFLPRPGDVHALHPVMFTPSLNASRSSSIFTSAPESASEDGVAHLDYDGYDSPPPATERLAELRNERRYRMLLNHDFHPSLVLPLWSPSPVAPGAVGYLSKPSGAFITLFNALDPHKSSGGFISGMGSIHGFGEIKQGSQRQEKRNLAQKGMDAISGFLTFRAKGDGPVSRNAIRRYSYPLRAGHRIAYLCTETTVYRYIENLDAPKKWFKANVDKVLELYGRHHPIQRGDLNLVIGTLDAPDYAMFVSHQHPDGQAHFNVFSSAKPGQEWGMFTTDTDVPISVGGPSYHEEEAVLENTRVCANKVSSVGNGWDTVLLARLRFKTDSVEPTSL